jgi:cation-transporting P-type ATPase I
VLPAVAVAIQPPERRDLRALAREGTEALDRPLREDILHRAAVTATPSLAAYAAATRLIGGTGAQGVGFGSICATQLALTVADGRTGDGLSPAVSAAAAATAGLIVAALSFPPARGFLGFGPVGPVGWMLILGSVAATAVLRSGTPLREGVPAGR